MSMLDLGLPDTLTFNFTRDVTSTTLKFPVPPGMNPVTFTAKLELPVAISYGSVTVTQENRTIAQVGPLPPNGSQIVIPLDGVRVSGNSLTLNMTMTAIPPVDFCWDYRAPVRLTGGAVTFAGTDAAPTAVATFLPPVLRRLTIAVPGNPSPAESTAAVQLAALLQRRYGALNFELLLVPLTDNAALFGRPAPLERAVILREGPDKGLTLETRDGLPTLSISGPGDELVNQVRLLGDNSLASALSTKAVAGPLSSDQTFAGTVMPLRLLERQPEISSEAIWPEVGITVDQTVFGRSMRGFHLYLVGSHTPLPADVGGEVVVSVDGKFVSRWPTEENGVIDHDVEIPDRLISRVTTVDVRVRTNGFMGGCGESPAMVLRINGDTQIESVPADPPVPLGFQSLPQSLLPRIRVGIGPDVFADTVRATQIVMALQRSSALPLTTVVTDIADATSGQDPAVLIAAQGWNDDTIPLPVRAEQGTVTFDGFDDGGNPTTVNVDSALPLGSLQTVVDGGRTLLVATSNGNPAQLDDLLRWIGAEPDRWNELDGRALISMPGTEPVAIPNPTIELTPRGENFYRWSGLTTVAGVAVAALSAAGAIAILLLARRRRSAGRHEAANQPVSKR